MTGGPPDEVLARPAERSVNRLPADARAHQGHRAGIVTRGVAAVVDGGGVVLVLLACWAGWAVLRFVLSPTTFSWPAPGLPLVIVGFELVAFAYLTVAWATTGRSYGAVLLGVRLVNHRGQLVRWSGSALRAAFCVLFPVGLLWVAVSPSNRSVQDLVLRTSVVYDWTQGTAAPLA